MKKLFPVIHHLNIETTKNNLEIIINNGCHGVFLINMDCDELELNESLGLAKQMGGKDFMVGVNRLGVDNKMIEHYIKTDKLVDAYWVDNPHYDNNSFGKSTNYLTIALEERKIIDPNFEFYGSVAFKYQKTEKYPDAAAFEAACLGWIPTTSGVATGVAADINKIKIMKEAIDTHPLAIASGITPENIELFLPYVDHFLVSTGISKDFYNFDNDKIKIIMDKINNYDQNR